MKNYKFEIAQKEDISEIAKIEEKYFSKYERILTFDFLMKWYEHNNSMYFVVKDGQGDIKAFVILVPIKCTLHNKLMEGEVSDFFEFTPEEVCQSNSSEYYYLADICLDEIGKNLSSVTSLLRETALFLYHKAKYVTTSPITPYGLRMTKHLGFEKVAEQKYHGELYPIYGLRIPDKDEKLSPLYERLVGDR